MADRDNQGGEQRSDGTEPSAQRAAQRGSDFDTLRETLEAILSSMRLSAAEKIRS